ncbi:MAG: phosphate ABC transporter permease subunit PstC [Thermoplasmata archaeon]
MTTPGNPFLRSLRAGLARIVRPIRRVVTGNRVYAVITGLGAAGVVGLAVVLVVVLYFGAKPTIDLFGFRYLTTRVWAPAPVNNYGIVPFVVGTLVTSTIALLISVPLSLGAAIFLTQHSPTWLRAPVGQVIELLAAIPSIVFGFWGLIVLVPIMRYDIEPQLKVYLGWTGLFAGTPIGLDVLTASVVLSIMTVPTITAISRDSIAAVPISQKEAAISLGATDWEVTRRAVIPYARVGIVAGVILGLGRALGETMAVTLVIGNDNIVPKSLIGQGQTISSLIANQFTEASGPLELSALIEAGLVLLALTLVINIGARVILSRFQVGQGGE